MKTSSEDMRVILLQRRRRNWLEAEQVRRQHVRRSVNRFLDFLPSAGIQEKSPGRC